MKYRDPHDEEFQLGNRIVSSGALLGLGAVFASHYRTLTSVMGESIGKLLALPHALMFPEVTIPIVARGASPFTQTDLQAKVLRQRMHRLQNIEPLNSVYSDLKIGAKIQDSINQHYKLLGRKPQGIREMLEHLAERYHKEFGYSPDSNDVGFKRYVERVINEDRRCFGRVTSALAHRLLSAPGDIVKKLDQAAMVMRSERVRFEGLTLTDETSTIKRISTKSQSQAFRRISEMLHKIDVAMGYKLDPQYYKETAKSLSRIVTAAGRAAFDNVADPLRSQATIDLEITSTDRSNRTAYLTATLPSAEFTGKRNTTERIRIPLPRSGRIRAESDALLNSLRRVTFEPVTHAPRKIQTFLEAVSDLFYKSSLGMWKNLSQDHLEPAKEVQTKVTGLLAKLGKQTVGDLREVVDRESYVHMGALKHYGLLDPHVLDQQIRGVTSLINYIDAIQRGKPLTIVDTEFASRNLMRGAVGTQLSVTDPTVRIWQMAHAKVELKLSTREGRRALEHHWITGGTQLLDLYKSGIPGALPAKNFVFTTWLSSMAQEPTAVKMKAYREIIRFLGLPGKTTQKEALAALDKVVDRGIVAGAYTTGAEAPLFQNLAKHLKMKVQSPGLLETGALGAESHYIDLTYLFRYLYEDDPKKPFRLQFLLGDLPSEYKDMAREIYEKKFLGVGKDVAPRTIDHFMTFMQREFADWKPSYEHTAGYDVAASLVLLLKDPKLQKILQAKDLNKVKSKLKDDLARFLDMRSGEIPKSELVTAMAHQLASTGQIQTFVGPTAATKGVVTAFGGVDAIYGVVPGINIARQKIQDMNRFPITTEGARAALELTFGIIPGAGAAHQPLSPEHLSKLARRASTERGNQLRGEQLFEIPVITLDATLTGMDEGSIPLRKGLIKAFTGVEEHAGTLVIKDASKLKTASPKFLRMLDALARDPNQTQERPISELAELANIGALYTEERDNFLKSIKGNDNRKVVLTGVVKVQMSGFPDEYRLHYAAINDPRLGTKLTWDGGRGIVGELFEDLHIIGAPEGMAPNIGAVQPLKAVSRGEAGSVILGEVDMAIRRVGTNKKLVEEIAATFLGIPVDEVRKHGIVEQVRHVPIKGVPAEVEYRMSKGKVAREYGMLIPSETDSLGFTFTERQAMRQHLTLNWRDISEKLDTITGNRITNTMQRDALTQIKGAATEIRGVLRNIGDKDPSLTTFLNQQLRAAKDLREWVLREYAPGQSIKAFPVIGRRTYGLSKLGYTYPIWAFLTGAVHLQYYSPSSRTTEIFIKDRVDPFTQTRTGKTMVAGRYNPLDATAMMRHGMVLQEAGQQELARARTPAGIAKAKVKIEMAQQLVKIIELQQGMSMPEFAPTFLALQPFKGFGTYPILTDIEQLSTKMGAKTNIIKVSHAHFSKETLEATWGLGRDLTKNITAATIFSYRGQYFSDKAMYDQLVAREGEGAVAVINKARMVSEDAYQRSIFGTKLYRNPLSGTAWFEFEIPQEIVKGPEFNLTQLLSKREQARARQAGMDVSQKYSVKFGKKFYVPIVDRGFLEKGVGILPPLEAYTVAVATKIEESRAIQLQIAAGKRGDVVKGLRGQYTRVIRELKTAMGNTILECHRLITTGGGRAGTPSGDAAAVHFPISNTVLAMNDLSAQARDSTHPSERVTRILQAWGLLSKGQANSVIKDIPEGALIPPKAQMANLIQRLHAVITQRYSNVRDVSEAATTIIDRTRLSLTERDMDVKGILGAYSSKLKIGTRADQAAYTAIASAIQQANEIGIIDSRFLTPQRGLLDGTIGWEKAKACIDNYQKLYGRISTNEVTDMLAGRAPLPMMAGAFPTEASRKVPKTMNIPINWWVDTGANPQGVSLHPAIAWMFGRDFDSDTLRLFMLTAGAEDVSDTGAKRAFKEHRKFFNQYQKTFEEVISEALRDKGSGVHELLNQQFYHLGTPLRLDPKTLTMKGHADVSGIIHEPTLRFGRGPKDMKSLEDFAKASGFFTETVEEYNRFQSKLVIAMTSQKIFTPEMGMAQKQAVMLLEAVRMKAHFAGMPASAYYTFAEEEAFAQWIAHATQMAIQKTPAKGIKSSKEMQRIWRAISRMDFSASAMGTEAYQAMKETIAHAVPGPAALKGQEIGNYARTMNTAMARLSVKHPDLYKSLAAATRQFLGKSRDINLFLATATDIFLSPGRVSTTFFEKPTPRRLASQYDRPSPVTSSALKTLGVALLATSAASLFFPNRIEYALGGMAGSSTESTDIRGRPGRLAQMKALERHLSNVWSQEVHIVPEDPAAIDAKEDRRAALKRLGAMILPPHMLPVPLGERRESYTRKRSTVPEPFRMAELSREISQYQSRDW